MHTKTILDFRGKYPKRSLFVLAVFLALAVGILDVLMGKSVIFAVLYLLPIILIAWFVGGLPVALMSSLCSIIWLTADVVSGQFYAHVSTAIWEAATVLCLFFIVGYSVAVMKKIW